MRNAAYWTAASPAMKVSRPARSNLAGSSARLVLVGPGSTALAAIAITMATGTFTMKIDRQPKTSVSEPPASGPTTKDRAATEPYRPNARPRSDGR
jgi:hypothetical protein